jgi:signal transduction histidine kinase
METPGVPDRRRQTRREEESRLHAIIDHVADGIVIVDAEGTLRFVNPAAEALFGRASRELVGEPFGLPLVASETAEIDVFRRSGEPLVAELRIVEMDWEHEPSLLVSLRDITSRREAEERLHLLIEEQAARWRAEVEERRSRFLAGASTVFDSSLDDRQILHELAVLATAPLAEPASSPLASRATPPRLADWCVIDVIATDGSLRRVAHSHHDRARAPLLAELVERFPPDWERPYPARQALRTGEPVFHPVVTDPLLESLTRGPEHAELLRRLGIGSIIAAPLVARGRTVGVVSFVRSEGRYDEGELALARDLAQRAALAVANTRLYREAQEASRAKSDFLAVMSHELRTPLNAIMGYTDLLSAGISGPLTEVQKKQLERIGASSRHLLRIVEEILNFARMEAGREEIRAERADLRTILSEVEAMVRPLAERGGLAFVADLPAEPLEIETDVGKLRQILLNLLSNAVKFTDEGSVRLQARSGGGVHRIRVEDTGIGISDEHLHRIFDPFWQVEQTTRRTVGGTGLGLSVALRLAELLGGELTVESTVGEGTTFTLVLPDRPPAGAADPAPGFT